MKSAKKLPSKSKKSTKKSTTTQKTPIELARKISEIPIKELSITDKIKITRENIESLTESYKNLGINQKNFVFAHPISTKETLIKDKESNEALLSLSKVFDEKKRMVLTEIQEQEITLTKLQKQLNN